MVPKSMPDEQNKITENSSRIQKKNELLIKFLCVTELEEGEMCRNLCVHKR
jgi:hypothetical protein